MRSLSYKHRMLDLRFEFIEGIGSTSKKDLFVSKTYLRQEGIQSRAGQNPPREVNYLKRQCLDNEPRNHPLENRSSRERIGYRNLIPESTSEHQHVSYVEAGNIEASAISHWNNDSFKTALASILETGVHSMLIMFLASSYSRSVESQSLAFDIAYKGKFQHCKSLNGLKYITKRQLCDSLQHLTILGIKRTHLSLKAGKGLRDNVWTKSWLSSVFQPPIQDITAAPIYKTDLDVLNRISIGERVEPKETMRLESLRLSTFSDFPAGKPFSIRFAQAGFYSTVRGDEVACYCCGVCVSNWRETDKPIEIHIHISPNCQFIVNNASVNVVITTQLDMLLQTKRNHNTNQENATGFTEKDHEVLFTKQSSKRCQNETLVTTHTSMLLEDRNGTSTPVQNQNLETSSVRTGLLEPTPAPKYPEYQTVQERKRSFNSCRLITVPIADLCLAGFYYAGMDDCTRCFHCGLGLKDWRSPDNPWIEHARFKSDCEYLRRTKGDEFVALVQATVQFNSETTIGQDIAGYTNQNPERAIIHHYQNTTVEVTDQLSGQLSTDTDVEEQVSGHADVVNTLVEMGFTKDIILKTINNCSDRKDSTVTVQTVLEGILRSENHAAASCRQDTAQNGHSTAREKPTVLDTRKIDLSIDAKELGSSQHSSENKYENKQSKNIKIDAKQRQKLVQEREELRAMTLCSVCKKNENSIAFLPCGHLVSCHLCAPSINNCSVCRQKIIGTVRTYRA